MPFLGETYALLTAVLWTGSSLVFAEATVKVGSVTVNVTRLIIATLLLLVTVLLFSLTGQISGSQIRNLALSGVAGLVFGDTFLFKSYEYNSARISSLIMSTAPPVTALLAYFFLGETLSFWGIVGMGVTLAGIALVIGGQRDPSSSRMKPLNIGIFYAFLGAVGQAGGLVLARMAFDEGQINGFFATFIRMASAVILILPLAILTRRYKNPFKIFSKERKAFSFTFIGVVLGPFFGVTLSLLSIVHTKVAIAATLIATVPIMMLPAVKVLYHEKLSWESIVGAFVAVGGVAILFLR
ncbi:MAG: DMT family transporter [Bacteroidota bacterium]